MAENKYWTFYGQGKIDAEQYYAEFLRDKSTNLVILRPPYIYGEYNYAQRESLIFRQLVEACAVAAGKPADIMEIDFEEGLKSPLHGFWKTGITSCLKQT